MGLRPTTDDFMSDVNHSPVPNLIRNHKSIWIALFAVLLALTALIYNVVNARRNAEEKRLEQDLGAQLDAASKRIQLLTQNLQVNERRLRDLEGVQKSLREEVLGVGQRAAMVESAVASLAGRQLDSSAALILNEAEFLLRMGQERLRLFNDVASTIKAFELADAQLAAVDNAQLTGVRQSLAAELKLLRDFPLANLNSVAAALDQAREWVTQLELPDRAPAADAMQAQSSHWYDRALAVLTDLVRVRKLDSGDRGLIGPLHLSATRSAIMVDLLLAKAALLEHDGDKTLAALSRIERTIKDGFEPNSKPAKQILQALSMAREAANMPNLPTVDQSLAELNNLRATLKLVQPPAAVRAR